MDDSKDQLRRLAIAVETLAGMTLEALNRIELQLSLLLKADKPKSKPSTAVYWIKYVLAPIAVGISSHLLTHLAK